MKRLEILVVIKLIFTFICLINSNAESVNAQITEFRKKTNVTGQRRNPTPPAPKVQVKYKIEYKPVTQFITPTELYVTALPDADIYLESLAPGRKFEKKNKADNTGVVRFEKLLAGKYKLSVSLKGYQAEEGEILIEAKKISAIPISLKKVTYDFSIQTNVEKGEVRFAPVKKIGEKPDRTLIVQETGPYCIVPIQNRKATIKELSEGIYNIDVSSPNAPEYQPEKSAIEIPEDIPEAKPGEPNQTASFEINLENTLSTGFFNQISVPDAWELPEYWKIDEKGLKGDGIGVALPKGVIYRYYKDFEMQSAVRLLNNSSVGFVVRAKDKKNYYLIELTGKNANQPYWISGWVVKDGKRTDRVLDASIAHVLKDDINKEEHFEVIIKAKGNSFKVFAIDTNGKERPLGEAVFTNNNFPIGAVGVSGIEKSSFEVGPFRICNEICPS